MLDIIRKLFELYFKPHYDYVFTFNKESNLWYIHIPWKWNHDNLQMVGGADKLLQYLSKGSESVSVSCWLSDPHSPNYFKLSRKKWSLFKGAFYSVENLHGFDRDIYICPVTLWVFGKYPKYIWVKKIL